MGKIEVSQRARAKAWAVRPGCYCEQDRTKWMAGVYDHVRIIQAFARFERDILATRTDATPVAWMPIESAPKDGTQVLIAGGTVEYDAEAFPEDRPFGGVHIASWCPSVEAWSGPYGSEYDAQFWHTPTHWMPLPATPDATNTHPPATDVAALVEAAKAFAEQADMYDSCEQHTAGCPDTFPAGEMLSLTVGDFRAIRAALAPFTKGK